MIYGFLFIILNSDHYGKANKPDTSYNCVAATHISPKRFVIYIVFLSPIYFQKLQTL